MAATPNVPAALSGGVYNLAVPTLSDGQKQSLQLDNKGNLKTVAGASTAIIGKVGIDQSSPGAGGTNAVYTPFQTPVSKSGTFTPGTATYTANTPVGPTGAGNAAFSISGLTPGGVYQISNFYLGFPATAFAVTPTIKVWMAETAPAATITDNTAPTFTAADMAAFSSVTTLGASTSIAGGTAAVQSAAIPGEYTADGSGKLYFMLETTVATAWTAPGVATWKASLLKQ